MFKFNLVNRLLSNTEKKLNRRSKKGLFLSVELVVIILLVIVIVIAVAMSSIHLRKLYIVNAIVREVMMLSEGVKNFKQIYGYYPGDLPSSEINGDISGNNMIANVASFEASTYTANAVFASTPDNFNLLVKPGSGGISGIKSWLAAQQMYLAKLVPDGMLDTLKPSKLNINATNYPSSIDDANILAMSVRDVFKSSVISGLNYVFYLDACDRRGICDSGAFPMVYNQNYGAYPRIWSGTPRIAAVFGLQLNNAIETECNTSGCLASYTSLALVNSDLARRSAGSASCAQCSQIITPDLAYYIDEKIDDGLPFGPNSKVIGHDSVSPVNMGPRSAMTYINNIWFNGSTGGVDIAGETSRYGCTTLFSTDMGVTSNVGATGAKKASPKASEFIASNFSEAKYSGQTVTSYKRPSRQNCSMLFAIQGAEE